MNLIEAKTSITKLLSEDKAFYEKYKPEIVDDLTLETEFGWVFYYQSYDFIYKNDERKMLIGNAPIMVDKLFNLIFRAGTMLNINDYVHMYMKDRGNLDAYHALVRTIHN